MLQQLFPFKMRMQLYWKSDHSGELSQQPMTPKCPPPRLHLPNPMDLLRAWGLHGTQRSHLTFSSFMLLAFISPDTLQPSYQC